MPFGARSRSLSSSANGSSMISNVIRASGLRGGLSPGTTGRARRSSLQHRIEPLHVLGRPAEAELRVREADSRENRRSQLLPPRLDLAAVVVSRSRKLCSPSIRKTEARDARMT